MRVRRSARTARLPCAATRREGSGQDYAGAADGDGEDIEDGVEEERGFDERGAAWTESGKGGDGSGSGSGRESGAVEMARQRWRGEGGEKEWDSEDGSDGDFGADVDCVEARTARLRDRRGHRNRGVPGGGGENEMGGKDDEGSAGDEMGNASDGGECGVCAH